MDEMGFRVDLPPFNRESLPLRFSGNFEGKVEKSVNRLLGLSSVTSLDVSNAGERRRKRG